LAKVLNDSGLCLAARAGKAVNFDFPHIQLLLSHGNKCDFQALKVLVATRIHLLATPLFNVQASIEPSRSASLDILSESMYKFKCTY
jgi:hypothetical protein